MPYFPDVINSPGDISAHEIATGLLVRGLSIDGDYLIVTNCTVNPVQDIDELHLIQAGPRAAIGNIGNKHIEGQIVCPVRVDNDGQLEPAVERLLENAQNPDHVMNIKTNHALSFWGLTAYNGGTDNNELLTFDCCLVKNLTLSVNSTSELTLTADIIGMIDTRLDSDIIAPTEGYLLHRTLTFADCDVSRYESDMRTISDLKIEIINEVETLLFLMQINEMPYDQINCMGVQSCRWQGYFEETLRRGADVNTFIHGGFMVEEDLQFRFGPLVATMRVPLFKIGEQPLTHSYIKRKTEFFAQISPEIRNPAGDLFSYT
jgi:hypothetical protein